jgi:hypothetical protein
MNSNLAEAHLQTIRLLMERSAIYRRALAPIMLLAGLLGLAAAGIGLGFQLESARSFAGLWLGTACVVVASAFLLVRRQALNDHEKFWSPPTRRVTQALLPPLASGMVLGGLPVVVPPAWSDNFLMVLVWLLFYGCALHSAGFFMERGIKWLGWVFIIVAFLLMIIVAANGRLLRPAAANWVMGLTFGGLHLACGVYLYFTERRHPVA